MNSPKTVVAAAILSADGKQVLAARRTSPPEAAGRWELPGGKVEEGETPEAALVREIGEELGCLIEVLDWLQGESVIGVSTGSTTGARLIAATARVVAGEPRPREHDQILWLAAEDLDSVDWLEPDRPFLGSLRHVLGQPESATLRGIFFDEEDARSAAATLEREGWTARVDRERYQGEDDDEDHPWSVETDAPELVLELLVDEYDGWLDIPEGPPDDSIAPEPVDLPDNPKRIKRPDLGDF
ncbi:(deoxy)nucleoside triphosphate pyrophosphohydrolase [Nocardioides sp.]|uniref:(deoxy)nucleoside triphosphate pyrophosphohydrolase n=1 Tax=Nocardioides sp. TaxID=35761 RepID=UPI0019C652FB|nr:(deoxy)nucleoside triphosphate pyrophosphohydrolase [Nocardioides sp.]MBC7279045.1 (deoxy)nucleoside triphosphate pyrophosphohydrolase [Nocardioides sp.]